MITIELWEYLKNSRFLVLKDVMNIMGERAKTVEDLLAYTFTKLTFEHQIEKQYFKSG